MTTNQTIRYARHSLLVPPNESVNAPFIENRGQVMNTDTLPQDDVRYYTRNNYPNTYIFDDKLSFVFAHTDTVPSSLDTMARLDLSFVSETSTVAVGLERHENFHNYYLGHIPEGRERVPLENKVLHPNIYTNIDALYGLGQDGFFARFVCKPGSNPGHIRMLFRGHTALSVETDGSLRIETDLEDLILAPPTAVLSDVGGTESDAGWYPEFVIMSDSTVRFSVGTVPSGSSVIIKTGRERYDPEDGCDYYWSTYFGETGNEEATGNDVDVSGFMYYTGITSSGLFPFTFGAFQTQLVGLNDAYIACFRQLDEQQWATFYGGHENSGGSLAKDNAISIKWNTQNNKVYVVGRTSSTDFPLKPESGYFNEQILAANWSSRGFIVKLNAVDGKRDWATFFGDSRKSYDAVTALHILENGNIMVGGYSFDPNTTQSSFPYFPNSTPGLTPHIQTFGALYIAEFNTSNEQVWATKLTNDLLPINPNVSVPTNLADIAEDGNGNIYAVGLAWKDDSNDFIPMGNNSMAFNTPTGSDVFIIRFSSAKKIEWSSYLGGDHIEWANSIVCLLNGSCYVTGSTNSDDFPVLAVGDPGDPLLNDLTYEGTSDIFITEFRIEDDGSDVMYWSRFLGGPGNESQPVISLNLIQNANPLLNTVGNATTIISPNEIALTGTVQNDFSPLTASSCPYYYGTINRGSLNTGGTDALVLFIKNRKVEFSTYWGGDAISGGRDFGSTISHGISSNEKPFVLVGGMTNSRESGGLGKTIPVCHELPHQNDYYQSNFLGGSWDAFISKIYYGDCLTTDVFSPTDEINKLDISPNPAVDYFTIHFLGIEDADFTISIYDATGHELTNTILSSKGNTTNSIQFEIASIPSGLYYVIAHSKNKVHSAKFIKI